MRQNQALYSAVCAGSLTREQQYLKEEFERRVSLSTVLWGKIARSKKRESRRGPEHTGG